jgi:glycosyltransferase involved in cell wall biosynthesis
MSVAVSVVVPAYNEGEGIVPVLQRLVDSVESDVEVLVVVDFPEDTTVPVVEKFAAENPHVRTVVNTYADGSDDPRQIDALARLVDRGVVVAAASRYTAGGQQVGGPLFKGMLSRAAGRSLGIFGRVGTKDATNSFKAYSTAFIREVGIHSRSGFEIGLELTAKARRLRRPVAELPTIWLDRDVGESNFQLTAWIPKYLRWYRFAFGPPLTLEQVSREAARIAALNNKS